MRWRDIAMAALISLVVGGIISLYVLNRFGPAEYGPHPPTRIEKLEAANVEMRARLTELERNAGACPW